MSLFGQLGLWAPSSGVRDVFTSTTYVQTYAGDRGRERVWEWTQVPVWKQECKKIRNFDVFGEEACVISTECGDNWQGEI
jgi:hypothetical protein